MTGAEPGGFSYYVIRRGTCGRTDFGRLAAASVGPADHIMQHGHHWGGDRMRVSDAIGSNAEGPLLRWASVSRFVCLSGPLDVAREFGLTLQFRRGRPVREVLGAVPDAWRRWPSGGEPPPRD